MKKTSVKMQKKVDSWVDELFDDECFKNSSGKVVRGPGIICSIWIILIIIGAITNILATWNLSKYNVSNGEILIQNFIDIILSMFQIYFTIRMCYICRPITGFFVLLVFNIIISAIRLKLFTSYRKGIMKMVKNQYWQK